MRRFFCSLRVTITPLHYIKRDRNEVARKPILIYNRQNMSRVEHPHRMEELSLLNIYREDMSLIPRLTLEEQREMLAQIYSLKKAIAEKLRLEKLGLPVPDDLLIQIETAEETRKRFVAANLRLAWHFAGKYSFDESTFLDLIQAANLALLHAVDSFDPNFNFQFSTYASVAIKRLILRKGLLELDTIKLTEETFLKVQTLKSVISHLEQVLGRTPAILEIAAELQITEEDVIELYFWMQQPIELDKPYSDDPNEEDDHNPIFIDQEIISPDVPIQLQELRAVLQQILENYPIKFKRNDLQKEVLSRVYGVYSGTMESYEEIAADLDLSLGEAKKLADEAIAIIKRRPGNLELLAQYL